MLNTALSCANEGIDFAPVHDSFWTHAEHAGTMGSIARNEFADLHAVPRIHELGEQLRRQHPDLEFPEPPETGSLSIDRSRIAAYAFS